MEHYKFYFEKLKVWENASEFYFKIHARSKKFPKDERFGLTSQIRRAASSVALNLCEGSARPSRKDQAHFSYIAFSSLMEVVNLLIFCRKLEYLTEDEYNEYRTDAHVIARQLNALKKSQESKK